MINSFLTWESPDKPLQGIYSIQRKRFVLRNNSEQISNYLLRTKLCSVNSCEGVNTKCYYDIPV